jgi:hypothetical protein
MVEIYEFKYVLSFVFEYEGYIYIYIIHICIGNHMVSSSIWN